MQTRADWNLQERFLFARATCFLSAIGFLLWGLAPLFIARALSGSPADPAHLLANVLVFAIAAIYLVLFLLLSRQSLLAVWCDFIASCLFMTLAIAVAAVSGFALASTFVFVACAMSCVASWLALHGMRRERAVPARATSRR